MQDINHKVEKSIAFLRSNGIYEVDVAIVLGTGLSDLDAILSHRQVIPYSSIPSFPTPTVDSHKGLFIYGIYEGKRVVLLSGRFHYYEGYEMDEVTYYVHVLKALSVKELIITNASGGLNPHFSNGEIIMVNDHINMFPANPLRGWNDDTLGVRFPDMLKTYPIELREKMQIAAATIGYSLKQGVYLGWQGPTLETPAEYKMARMLGADVLGMSSVPEVIVAKYRSIPVLMLSTVSNECFPISKLKETTLEEVIKIMNQSAAQMTKLIQQYLKN
jgi:purine-nucleoside phosphorylase